MTAKRPVALLGVTARACRRVVLSIAICSASLTASAGAQAQDSKQGIVSNGDLVVTGFSGAIPPPANPPLPAGVNELDETFINGAGASLKVFDVRNPGGAPNGQVINAPVKFQAFARDIGQVFGIALDDADPPNIYAAATSVHGLQIVIPDADGDGRPERVKLGQPGAQWMRGQFGTARGGGPGTVWKIDGTTGAVSVFANIASGGVENSGPGLGNIAYDRQHKQLYVSDLDTGLIHRLNMNGDDLGTFDHGTQGRPADNLEPVPIDAANRLDITDPAFDAEDSESWGLADPARRVWGLAYHGVRLYYAVAEGPQIWSVGINQDGGFAGDPRWELDIDPEPKDHPVSDIAFTSGGVMIVAQRGGITSSYDYSEYHSPRKNRVLRFTLESPDDPSTDSRWAAPEEYAIGFPATHQNTSGGVAIGYGYRQNNDGSYRFGACEGTLWTTGDALRNSAADRQRLQPGGPLLVHGLQGNGLELEEPDNAPPWKSYFVDYDGEFDDPQASGLVGDVEIARDCRRKQAMDLRIIKRGQPERCTAGNRCTFVIEIENVGSVAYSGPLVVHESADGGGRLVGHGPAPEWQCRPVFPGLFECVHAPMTLAPGQRTTFEVTVQLPPWWTRYVYRNCAELVTPGTGEDDRTFNNRICGYAPVCEQGVPNCRPDLAIEKFAPFGNCDAAGECLFAVRVTNVGATNYTGSLSFRDTIVQPGASLLDWGPQPDWTVAAGPVAGSYDFTHPAPVTLSPGEFREMILIVQRPPLGAGHTHVRNCSRLDWQGGPHDFNPFNEFACADISIFPPGHPLARPKLAIAKDAHSTCLPLPGGPPCVFRTTITNVGGAPYLEPFDVTDTQVFGALSTLSEYNPKPPWTCMPVGGGPQVNQCKRPPEPGGLQPGQSIELWLKFDVPAGTVTPNVLVNQAEIKHDNDGDGVPEIISATATALICNPGAAGDCPQDLALVKYVQADPCWPGFPCNFTVSVANAGTADQPAGLVITDVPNPDAGAFTLLWPPAPNVTCVPAGPNQNCTVNVVIAAGGIGFLNFEFAVPADYPWTTLKNCASIAPSPTNTIAANDEACATAFIPGPDLAPFGGTECQRGVPCKLDVTVDNKGKRPFRGAAGLEGKLSPAVQITSISSQTPGLTCAVVGNGAYECNAPNLTLAPGGAAKLQLTILVPEGFQGTRITHGKDMVWPDQKVKDRNPQNDHHDSIITIAAPKTPPPLCRSGKVIRNQCICPAGWERERDQRRPNTYRCVEPPPQITCTGGRVVKNTCICPSGWGRERIRRNVYRCEKPEPEVVCTGGRIVKNTCVCPANWDRVRVRRDVYRCVEPKPEIACINGRVANNTCVCRRGWDRDRIRPNVYRCVEPKPTVVCTNGQVVNNNCICNKGWDRERIRPNVYRCQPPKPSIVCAGGKVSGGRCFCTRGWTRVQTGKTAWRCDPPRQSTPTPSITCTNGSIRNGQCVCPTGDRRVRVRTNVYRCEAPGQSTTVPNRGGTTIRPIRPRIQIR